MTNNQLNKFWRVPFAFGIIAVGFSLYCLWIYIVWPSAVHYFLYHPHLSGIPKQVLTGEGKPLDPLNVAIIGTRENVLHVMADAGWKLADRLSIKNDLELAESTIFNKPYEKAPMSVLYLYNRGQDLGFEKEDGHSPRKRHHVRFWEAPSTVPGLKPALEPLWIGAAIYDRGVSFHVRAGKITHDVDKNTDPERDRLVHDLESTRRFYRKYFIEGLPPNNGTYTTDGKIAVVVLHRH